MDFPNTQIILGVQGHANIVDSRVLPGTTRLPNREGIKRSSHVPAEEVTPSQAPNPSPRERGLSVFAIPAWAHIAGAARASRTAAHFCKRAGPLVTEPVRAA